jgi:hypothetical protein
MAISRAGNDEKCVQFAAQGFGLYGIVLENNGMGLFAELHWKIRPPCTNKIIILVGFRFPGTLRAPKRLFTKTAFSGLTLSSEPWLAFKPSNFLQGVVFNY